MDGAISKLLFIGAAVAVAAAVVAIMWSNINSNTPGDTDVTDYSSLTSETVCDAAGGDWKNSACAAPTN